MAVKNRIVVDSYPKSTVTEAFRSFRTNLQFTKIDQELKILMFTSAGPDEGKSTVAANTGIIFANAGKKVLIIDCDLRKPVQHQIFQKINRGLTDYLSGDCEIYSLIQHTTNRNVDLLTSGPIPPNPAELLGTTKIQQLFGELRKKYDYLIIDVPPVIPVTDACVLASKVDGVVLVIGAGIVRPEIAKQAKELLQKAQGNILGVVLNRVEIESKYASYYCYIEQQN
ncbi:MAG TPA: CpsD/CapB family tyrosine-protein kinase [Bacillota bacterium]|jgi:capsular exopolysaccharide synthesis family protein|nr:CpsD/CapB family tyrosine-protein kinase [Bacillota bacterium]HPO96326.1 CpsD/CapB family tyrosine-protein kinase [Bacillota bacterium]